MAFVLPLLIMLAAGMLFMVYTGWQDLKVQQAANLLARVEGQEKVSGGMSLKAINDENGFGPGTGFVDGDARVDDKNFETQDTHLINGGSPILIKRLKNLLLNFFPHGGVFLSAPRSGQNVDMITVTKPISTLRIPFMKNNAGLPKEITLRGMAYGGEDSYMYALPRWGKTSETGETPEWRNLLIDAAKHQHASD